MGTPFEVSHSGEPHARARQRLIALKPEIRELFGYDASTAVITFLVVLIQLGLAWSFQRFVSAVGVVGWALLVPVAYALGGLLNHWLGMAIHETSHNLAWKTPRGNVVVSLLANVPMVLPIAMTFRRYHLDHHRYLGVDGEDTDLPHPREVQLIGNSRWKKFVWLFFYLFVYTARGATFARRVSRGELLNGAMSLAINLALYRYFGGYALAYLALSTFFGYSLHPAAAHFIHEHYLFQDRQETYSYYGPLNWFTFNVGYHNEHHDFMNVPGSKLPALRALAATHYQSLKSHDSWTFVLWKFITDQRLGLASRVVRSREAYLAGRAALIERQRLARVTR
jgi:sphingolipid delta-4 desaturase